MTSINNGENEIQYTLSNVLLKCQKNNKTTYTIDLPKIVCTNEKDAKTILYEINDLVSKLSHELMKK